MKPNQMTIYKYPQKMTRSSDVETDFFKIIPGVLQRYTLVPYNLIICFDRSISTNVTGSY